MKNLTTNDQGLTEVHLLFDDQTKNRLLQDHSDGQMFMADRLDDEFYAISLDGEEKPMEGCSYLRCAVKLEDILMAASAARVGNVHTNWEMRLCV